MVELATSSSDRRTKVAACELLHSLVLFMVGRGATQVVERSVDRRHCMALLFKKVFPAIMQLACDVDQVGLINNLIHSIEKLIFVIQIVEFYLLTSSYCV